MSDLTAPETLPEPPRRDRWMIGTALASLMLHAGVLALMLWQPLPEIAEAAQPPAIDVELVPPPEAASEPSASEEPSEQPAGEPAEEPPPAEEPSEDAPAGPEAAPPTEAPSAEETSAEEAPATTPPAEAASAETSAREQAAAPADETSAPEAPSETEASAAPQASEATASAEAAPQQGLVDAAKVAPIPLARPAVRGLTAQSGAAEEGDATPADTVAVAEGTVTAATPEEPDVATLELGAPRSAERFYLEAMLSTPSMARASEMIKTLPREKRVAQSCNLEALAQIGNAGEGFTPDVVMAEAYARSEMTGTRLVADGAIFRSQEKWYGVAFDCTLSDDLTSVTSFSYRLGADVTEAVLARLNKT